MCSQCELCQVVSLSFPAAQQPANIRKAQQKQKFYYDKKDKAITHHHLEPKRCLLAKSLQSVKQCVTFVPQGRSAQGRNTRTGRLATGAFLQWVTLSRKQNLHYINVAALPMRANIREAGCCAAPPRFHHERPPALVALLLMVATPAIQRPARVLHPPLQSVHLLMAEIRQPRARGGVLQQLLAQLVVSHAVQLGD